MPMILNTGQTIPVSDLSEQEAEEIGFRKARVWAVQMCLYAAQMASNPSYRLACEDLAVKIMEITL